MLILTLADHCLKKNLIKSISWMRRMITWCLCGIDENPVTDNVPSRHKVIICQEGKFLTRNYWSTTIITFKEGLTQQYFKTLVEQYQQEIKSNKQISFSPGEWVKKIFIYSVVQSESFLFLYSILCLFYNSYKKDKECLYLRFQVQYQPMTNKNGTCNGFAFSNCLISEHFIFVLIWCWRKLSVIGNWMETNEWNDMNITLNVVP